MQTAELSKRAVESGHPGLSCQKTRANDRPMDQAKMLKVFFASICHHRRRHQQHKAETSSNQ
jgi:hypothetical protein